MRILWTIALLTLPSITQAQQPGSAESGALSLRPGDLVRISVWREPDLGGDFLVSPEGTVVLPLIGVQQVTTRPFELVRDTLMAQYREQLRNTSITILPLRRIYVLGEVAQPGLLAVDPTITLAGVLALAGGATPSGDLNKIRIVRNEQVISRETPAHLALSNVDIRSGDQIFVERRNWFERNSTFVVSALLSITSIVITVLR